MFHEHKSVDLRQLRNFEFVGFSLSASLKSARQRENLVLGVTNRLGSLSPIGGAEFTGCQTVAGRVFTPLPRVCAEGAVTKPPE